MYFSLSLVSFPIDELAQIRMSTCSVRHQMAQYITATSLDAILAPIESLKRVVLCGVCRHVRESCRDLEYCIFLVFGNKNRRRREDDLGPMGLLGPAMAIGRTMAALVGCLVTVLFGQVGTLLI